MSSDFIKEKIKDKPIDKKKLAKKLGYTVLIAIVFGAVSALVFGLVYSRVRKEEAPEVKEVELSGPESLSVSDDEILSGDGIPSDEDSVSVGYAPSLSADEADGDTVSADAASESENSAAQTIVNNITNKLDLTPESYAKLHRRLHDVALDAERSIVTVTGTTTDTDWFENTFENGNSTAGVIIADNGRQLLVLTDSRVTENADEISVRFADGTTAKATIIKTDPDTSLQVVGIELTDIGDETKRQIESASLGSTTYASTVGTPVIAIGSPLGFLGSEGYGLITSMSQEEEMSDFNVHLLTTDIFGSENASGVVIDYNGKVMGVITTGYQPKDTSNLITTYSISDIKDVIENLANGKDRPYLGVVGTSVTEEAAAAHDMPKGAYVINVDADSPAMKAGIQSGDVITRIGTQTITDYSDYTKALTELAPEIETVVTVQRFSRGDYTELTFETELSKR